MKEISISHPSDAWQRLDKFIKKYLPNAPLGGIYKMLRTGKIKVNGKKKDQTYKIELEDTIQFWFPDEELASLKEEVWSSKEMENQELSKSIPLGTKTKNQELSILYEDEYLLVVNKPAGMNVHPGDHKTKEVSLIELVQDYLGGKHDSLTFKPALVHRIDRDTSGCVLIAKEKETLELLLEQLQTHKIEKVYHAITLWIPEKSVGTIRAKILRIENAKDEAKVRIDENGQNAVTHYKLIESWGISRHTRGRSDPENRNLDCHVGSSTKQKSLLAMTDTFSLFECRIETGRTHQIRVHLSFINCPIIGDKAYGNPSINSFIRRNFGITRQLLHAFRLSFIHPKTKKALQVEAPYPEDFRILIKK